MEQWTVDAINKCLPDYRLQSLLGKGAYGNVYKACHISDSKRGIGFAPDKKDCASGSDDGASGYAIKLSDLETQSHIASAYLELESLKLLQDKTYINSQGKVKPLVPKLYYGTICDAQDKDEEEEQNATSILVMDQYDADVLKVGKLQYNRAIENKDSITNFPRFSRLIPNTEDGGRDRLLLTSAQFEDLFRIALELDKLGLVHGDLYPAQFLIRSRAPDTSVERKVGVDMSRTVVFPWNKIKKPQEWDIAIGDFGLPRTWGWMYSLGCPAPRSEVKSERGINELGPDIADYFNRWQLSYSMIDSNIDVYVEDPITGKFLLYSGINDLPEWWITLVEERCPSLIGRKEVKPTFGMMTVAQVMNQYMVDELQAKRMIYDSLKEGLFTIDVERIGAPTFARVKHPSYHTLARLPKDTPEEVARFVAAVREYLSIVE